MRPHEAAAIKAQVIAEYAGDNVREDEVVLTANGDIIIDRRKTVPWATPLVVGCWKTTPDNREPFSQVKD